MIVLNLTAALTFGLAFPSDSSPESELGPVGGLPASGEAAADTPEWFTDLGDARAEARRTGRSIVLVAVDPDDTASSLFEATVLSDQAVLRALARHVPVRIDVAADPRAWETHSITALPSVIMLNPVGEEEGRLIGHITPETARLFLGAAD